MREFTYAADSWDRERCIVTHLEFGTQGNNPRFVVTHLDLPAQTLYDALYCLRAIALAGTELAYATAAAIRVKLLKIGAAVIRNTRRVRILPASHHPMRNTFLIAARAFAP